MPTLQLGVDQIIQLVRQLSPEERLRLRRALDEDTDAWWEETIDASESRLCQLCAKRGLDWDALSDEERIEFVDALVCRQRDRGEYLPLPATKFWLRQLWAARRI